MWHIDRLAFSEIGGDQFGVWSEIQESHRALASPFFAPGFAAAIASVQSDVTVGVLRQGDTVVGFFPFQHDGSGGGRAIGEPVCDFQGIITNLESDIPVAALLSGCGLARWSFSHMIAEQGALRPFRREGYDSPFIDLVGGFERYRAGRRNAGTQQLQQVGRRRRQFEREVGPLHFEASSTCPEMLGALMRLKSEQYHRTGSYDRFAIPWIVALLGRLLDERGEVFGGILSILSTPGRLVAAHFGLRGRRTWHWWFPAYDPEFARYSPGLILLVEMMQAAESLGMDRIDLGRGEALYKRRFMTGVTPVYSGCVEAAAPSSSFRAT
jgi:CelD/BcsL family acetyltransferase involved in cellulose biosynthesis